MTVLATDSAMARSDDSGIALPAGVPAAYRVDGAGDFASAAVKA